MYIEKIHAPPRDPPHWWLLYVHEERHDYVGIYVASAQLPCADIWEQLVESCERAGVDLGGRAGMTIYIYTHTHIYTHLCTYIYIHTYRLNVIFC